MNVGVRRGIVACVLCMILSPPAFSDGGNQFSLTVTPSYFMPFQTTPAYFAGGGGAGIALEYTFPVVDFLGARVDVNGSYLPIVTRDGCALASVGIGPIIAIPPIGGFTNRLFGSAGYYYGVIADASNSGGGNLYFSGGLRSGWQISPTFAIGAEAAYRHLLSGASSPLFSGLTLGISGTLSFLKASPCRINDVILIEVFPVLFKFYDASPIGKVTIENGGSAPITDLEVTFSVDKYMDNPTRCPTTTVLKGGQKVSVDLFALFSDKVLSITESTVVSGKVTVSYVQDNKKVSVSRSASLRVKDRNAITWDDDRKIAAFVMNKDPVIIEIAKSLARVVKESPGIIDENFRTAIAVHESLHQYGMTYVVDPTSSYAEKAKDKSATDYIQYPRGTLVYKSGDCDDLSVLYASLLQAVGIDTAFITVPGHIYIAFALKLSPERARKTFANPDALIFMEDRAWVPLEVTMTTGRFLDAWATGAQEWAQNKGAAQLIPVARAWETYEPIGYFEDTKSVAFAPESAVKAAYAKEFNRFVDRDLAVLKSRVDTTKLSGTAKASALNLLGVLHVQYGKIDAARQYFAQAMQENNFYPALVNAAHLAYVDGDYATALVSYQKAQKIKPDNAQLVLMLFQTYVKLGNTREAETSYQNLQKLDPALATSYAYLATGGSGTARAAAQGSDMERMVWQEE